MPPMYLYIRDGFNHQQCQKLDSFFIKRAILRDQVTQILMYLFVALRQAIQYPGYSACLLCLYVQMICNGIPQRL